MFRRFQVEASALSSGQKGGSWVGRPSFPPKDARFRLI